MEGGEQSWIEQRAMLSCDVSMEASADPTRSSKAKPSELSQVGVQEDKRDGPLYLHVRHWKWAALEMKQDLEGGGSSAEAVFLSPHRG